MGHCTFMVIPQCHILCHIVVQRYINCLKVLQNITLIQYINIIRCDRRGKYPGCLSKAYATLECGGETIQIFRVQPHQWSFYRLNDLEQSSTLLPPLKKKKKAICTMHLLTTKKEAHLVSLFGFWRQHILHLEILQRSIYQQVQVCWFPSHKPKSPVLAQLQDQRASPESATETSTV